MKTALLLLIVMANVIPATTARSQQTETPQDSPTIANLKRKLADLEKEKRNYDDQQVIEENLETRELNAPSMNKTEANWHKSQADFYHRQVLQYRDWSAKKQNEIYDIDHQIFVEQQKESKQQADKLRKDEEYEQNSRSGDGTNKASKTLPPMKPIPQQDLPNLEPRSVPENGDDALTRKYQPKNKVKFNPETKKFETVPTDNSN